ncbi:MAG: TonB-dependent receptor family protein [Nevskiales bacterium]
MCASAGSSVVLSKSRAAWSFALCALFIADCAAAADPPAIELGPIVITGARAERSTFELPFAVSQVEADELSSAGAQINLSEALARVPGLLVNNRSNYAQDLQINSRGFGARASFGVRGLRLYADGIPGTAPDGQGQVSHFDLASAERVEILRGPFSALYGNSSGGVISVSSRSPEDKQLWASASAAEFGLRQFRFGGQGRFQNTWSALANYSDLEIDGFRPHSRAERRLAFGRLGFDGTGDKLVFTASDLEQPAQDPLGLSRVQFEQTPRQTAPQAEQFDTRKDTAQSQAGLSWNRRLDAGPLRDLQIAGFSGRRAVTQFLAIPVAAQSDPRHSGGVVDFERSFGGLDARTRLRLGAVELIVGLAYEQQDEDRRGYENFVGTGTTQQLGVTGALRRDEFNRVDSFDQYLQAEWRFAPAWSGTLGVRRGELRFSSRDRYFANGDDSGRRNFSYVNPVASLSFQAAPAVNLYVSSGRGFESPTLNELSYRPDGGSGFNRTLEAQTSRQFEIGAKLRKASAQLEIALFHADTDDELVIQTNAGGRSSFANAGRTRRQGAELAAYWNLTTEWQSRLALTWLDARYQDAFLTCAAVPCTMPTLEVPAGKRIPATARESAYLELAWRPRSTFKLALEGRAVSRIAVNDVNSDFASGYGLLALRAELQHDLGPWRLRTLARLDNVLDRTYVGSVIVNEANGRFFEPGAPRAALLSLSLEQRL